MQYSPNPAINSTIQKLISLGLPPIPVAPKQDGRTSNWHHIVAKKTIEVEGERVIVEHCVLDDNLNPKPRFTGKNPSYLSSDGSVFICKHGEFQDRLPTHKELKKFFANPKTGVGTLGGHGGVTWIDIDRKCYPSQEDCDRDANAIIAASSAEWVERTGSNGYRIAIKTQQDPTFTNFAATPGGKHVGEALHKGRFTVLAPSLHPNGNQYRRIKDGNPIEVESLEVIGVFPSKDAVESLKSIQKSRARRASDPNYGKPSDPTNNPHDIRNFAKYFVGYDERADGWGYAQCPHHENGSSLTSFRVNLATGAFKSWCECSTKDVYKSGLKLAQSRGHVIPSQKLIEASEGKPEQPTEESWEERHERVSRESWERSKAYTPTYEINQRYVSIDKELIENADILALKSAMGSGKTGEIIRILTSQADMGAVAIGSRNGLLLQSCVKWSSAGREFYHLHEHDAWELVRDPYSRIACCVDSLLRFEDSDFDEKIVILDESLSIVKHALIGGTLKKKRQQCLDKLEQAIKRAKLTVCFDGNNSDIAIDYIQSLRGEGCRVIKILNHHEGQAINVEIIKTIKYEEDDTHREQPNVVVKGYEPLLNKIGQTMQAVKHTSKGTPKSVVVVSDWQKKLEALEKVYSEKGFNVVRIDSKTKGQYKDFLEEPDKYLEECQVDLLLMSPTAESGVDISITNYFHKGFGLFIGLIDTDTQKQFLRRVRNCLDWSVWCQEYCFAEDVSGARSTFHRTVSRELFHYLASSVMASLEDFEEQKSKLLAQMSKDRDNIHNVTAMKFIAARNYELTHTRECLELALKADGHQVTTIEVDANAPQHGDLQAIKDAKDEAVLEAAIAIFDADDIPYMQALQIKSSFKATGEEWNQAEKAILKHRLPGIELTPCWDAHLIERVLFKDPKLIQRLTRFWFLNNLRAAKVQAQEYWAAIAERDTIMLADIRSDYLYLKTLDELGITALIGQEGLDNCSEDILRIYKTVKRSVPKQTALRRKPGKHNPVAFVGKLCAAVGIEAVGTLKEISQRGAIGGDRHYRYKHPNDQDTWGGMHEAILSCLDVKFDKYILRAREQAQTELDLPDHLDRKLYKNIGLGDQGQSLGIQGIKGDSENRSKSVANVAVLGTISEPESPPELLPTSTVDSRSTDICQKPHKQLQATVENRDQESEEARVAATALYTGQRYIVQGLHPDFDGTTVEGISEAREWEKPPQYKQIPCWKVSRVPDEWINILPVKVLSLPRKRSQRPPIDETKVVPF